MNASATLDNVLVIGGACKHMLCKNPKNMHFYIIFIIFGMHLSAPKEHIRIKKFQAHLTPLITNGPSLRTSLSPQNHEPEDY